MLQGYAIEVFHGNGGHAILLTDVVNGADIWMIECRGSLRLALKSAERLRVARELVGREFQCDETMQPRISGLINHAHPAAAQLLHDAVVRNGLADHRRESYASKTGKSMKAMAFAPGAKGPLV